MNIRIRVKKIVVTGLLAAMLWKGEVNGLISVYGSTFTNEESEIDRSQEKTEIEESIENIEKEQEKEQEESKENIYAAVVSEVSTAKTDEKIKLQIQAENTSESNSELRLYFCEASKEELEHTEHIEAFINKPSTAVWIEGLNERKQLSLEIKQEDYEREAVLELKNSLDGVRVVSLYASVELPAKAKTEFSISVGTDVPGNLAIIPAIVQTEKEYYGIPHVIKLEERERIEGEQNLFQQNQFQRKKVSDRKAVQPYDTRGEIVINLHDYDDRCLAVYNGGSIPGIMHKKVIEEEGINRGRPFTFQYYMCDRRAGYERWQNNYYMEPDKEIPKKYQKGIVAPILYQGYPVLSDATTNPGYSLSYLFNQTQSAGIMGNYSNVTDLFYKDDDGTYHFDNRSENIQLQEDGRFSHTPGGWDFLPLTNLSGQYKNFWFGMDMSLQFTIPEGKTINGEDMIYKFYGDDDLWVYIDDVLVLDIGGIHSGLGGTINFTTGIVQEDWIYTTKYGQADTDPSARVTGTLQHSVEESFKKAGRTWNDQVGSKHTMKIFYLERGYGGSHCSMSFKLPVVSSKKRTDITVHKVWEDSNNQSGVRPDSAIVDLYKDNQIINTVNLSEENNWTHTWKDLIYQEETTTYTYHVQERKVPGYEGIVSRSGSNEETWKYQITNKIYTGSMTLQKQSSMPEMTNQNQCYSLKGAEYGIYRDEGCKNLIKTVVTDENGYAVWSEIPFGNYYVREIKASQGFELDAGIYPVNIVENHASVTVKVKENPGYEGTVLTIDKIWDGKSTQTIPSLEGTQFTIKYYDGYYDEQTVPADPMRTWVLEVKKNKDTEKFLTGLSKEYVVETVSDALYKKEDGQPCIPYGTITIEETKAAPGYTLEGNLSDQSGKILGRTDKRTVLKITNEEGTPHLEGGTKFLAADHPIEGSIKLKKRDADGKTPLQGVIFELKDSSGNRVETKTTDAAGEVVFDHLYPDHYKVVETKTKEGNSLLKEPLEIEIPMRLTEEKVKEQGIDPDKCKYDPSEKVYFIHDLTYEITNHGNFIVPMTGGAVTLWDYLPLAAGITIMIGVVGFLIKKREESLF